MIIILVLSLCPLGPRATEEDFACQSGRSSATRRDCGVVDDEQTGIRGGCWTICGDRSGVHRGNDIALEENSCMLAEDEVHGSLDVADTEILVS